ncbi:hypothetical protein Solca_2127 [Solitalea canadensis DSM 3403]|uniref:Isoprenylcysteine carboxyl methyltransferase (ICMT) family protein n=2 Tax=Solitalea canadensis TaxID=995 RepID=H8KU69_SOLCM|nr:hypothetical protein Solca_2127 [Solitalea canadensis DSM 3403]
MPQPSIIKHIRDILILPFTMTVIIPYLCYDKTQMLFIANPFFIVLGVLFLLTGLSLFIWTVYLFRTFGKGTLAPWTPTQTLVIKGPYKYCRNPMITGVFFILLGETLTLNSVNLLIFAAIFFIINTIYFILKEEPDLKERFGGDYQKYKEHVPRWIPRLKPYTGLE